jgi:glycine/D-amino acid oxidase-like deaminating enzyme
MYNVPFTLSPSLWSATAISAPSTLPLLDNHHCDVAVIGGGFAGLSAALHLAEKGVNVSLLEAKEIGFGASGRNGGQVIPGLKYDPDELIKMFGNERGQQLVAFAGSTADVVFDLIARHQIDVPHKRSGWIQGAHDNGALELAQQRAEQWARHGASVRLLDAKQIQDLLGTDRYLGGWVDERAGAVQPLSYVRGLACAAIKSGARVHTESPVQSLTLQNGKWQLTTDKGLTVTADRVVMCTNAYGGDLWPKLKTSIIDANSFQVATGPLPDHLLKNILPQGHVCSDARKLLLYFRLDHQGRLLMGGRGPFREPKAQSDWAHLERVMHKLFPQMKSIPIEFRWGGRVAVTRDFLPHLHEPAPGLLIDIGCMGRGVGLQTSMGRAIANYVVRGDKSTLPFQITAAKPFPLYGLRRAYVNAVLTWYRISDGGL